MKTTWTIFKVLDKVADLDTVLQVSVEAINLDLLFVKSAPNFVYKVHFSLKK